MFYVRNNNRRDNLFDSFRDLFNENMKDMRTDIMELDNEYMVMVEVPGVKKDDISITVSDDTLTINVNKNKDNKDTEYLVKEISNYSISRSFYLEGIDEDTIKAKLNDGILVINLLKNKKTDSKRIVNIE